MSPLANQGKVTPSMSSPPRRPLRASYATRLQAPGIGRPSAGVIWRGEQGKTVVQRLYPAAGCLQVSRYVPGRGKLSALTYLLPVGPPLLLGRATPSVPPLLMGAVQGGRISRRQEPSRLLGWGGQRTGSRTECPRACGCAALGPLVRPQVVASPPATRSQASRATLGGSCWPRP